MLQGAVRYVEQHFHEPELRSEQILTTAYEDRMHGVGSVGLSHLYSPDESTGGALRVPGATSLDRRRTDARD